MKKTHQNPINIEKQLENLIGLDLIIKDKAYARKVLERISYYRIIKAYSITLKKKVNIYRKCALKILFLYINSIQSLGI